MLIYANALESHSSFLLNYFSDVKVVDAITISLIDQVADDYVGMGGRNVKLTLKIQTLYSTINHSVTGFDIISGVTHDTNALTKMIGELTDEIAFKCIKKAIIQNEGNNISNAKRQLLHWNLMIINISEETLSSGIITELYRIRWQIEELFKVLKSTLSIDKMHIGKTKYVEVILYSRLLGTLLTMPLYESIDQSWICKEGRGCSIQRFYTLLSVDLYSFYTVKRVTIHIYNELSILSQRIEKLALHEKRLRQSTYSRIESYLEESIEFGKT